MTMLISLPRLRGRWRGNPRPRGRATTRLGLSPSARVKRGHLPRRRGRWDVPASTRILDQILDVLERLGALLGPAFLVVLGDLDRRHRRHPTRQFGKIDVAAGRPAEGF